MPFGASTTTVTFFNAASLTADPAPTEIGTATLAGAGVLLTHTLGMLGSDITPSNAAALKAVLAEAITKAEAAPTKGFSLDVVDVASDTDPERIEYLENSGKVQIWRTSSTSLTMLLDTARGLLVALGILVP